MRDTFHCAIHLSDRSEIIRAVVAEELREREERHRAVEERDEFEGLQVDPGMVFCEEIRDRRPGDTNVVKWGFDLHPQVTMRSAGFLADALVFIGDNFGWFYIPAANVFLVTIVLFGFSRFGQIRLGGPEAKPEFTTFA